MIFRGSPACRRALCSCVGSGEHSDIVRNLNVRHHSPDRSGAAHGGLRKLSMNEDIPLPLALPAVVQKRFGQALVDPLSKLRGMLMTSAGLVVDGSITAQ
jgi:hypothetical protein